MIGNCVNLAESAIRQRFDAEILDLVKLLQSKLKFKNPADLSSDAETPMPEVLAWAIMLSKLFVLNATRSGTRSRTCPILAPSTRIPTTSTRAGAIRCSLSVPPTALCPRTRYNRTGGALRRALRVRS